MVGLLRHRQTKEPDSARPYLNRRATPRLHRIDLGQPGERGFECNREWLLKKSSFLPNSQNLGDTKRKVKKVVCRASWCNFIFANFGRRSFSTGTWVLKNPMIAPTLFGRVWVLPSSSS